MNRRRFFGSLSVTGSVVLAGCLQITGDESDVQGEYEIDPSTVQFDYECEEANLFKDTVRLSGRAIAVFLGTSAVEWHIEMPADIDFRIEINLVDGDEYARLPDLQVIDPDGRVVLDETHPDSGRQAISTETEGGYIIRAQNPEWTTVSRWRFSFSWYNEIGCTRITTDASGNLMNRDLSIGD